MEELPHLGDGSSSAGSSRGAFLYLPSSAVATATTTSAPPPPRSAVYEQSYYYCPTSHPYFHTPPPKTEAGSSQFQTSRVETLSQGVISQSDIEEIKARIMSHPRYSTLLGAFVDCQKVGAPPEVVERLSAITHELASRPRFHSGSYPDPELDQFMESYCEMLIKYREELTRPLQEATDFLKKMESQFNALTNTSTRGIFSSGIPKDEKCGGGGGGGGGVDSSTEEEQDASGGEAELREIDPHAEDKELKHHLLKKYGSYLSSLRQQLSKKKKKEKLPKDARQKLLHWWELHYTWPYPSEAEKVALAESTGLDQKQINNWFINQRKRHWKPSADMQFALMDGFHPQNAAAALYTQWQSMGDGTYHLHP